MAPFVDEALLNDPEQMAARDSREVLVALATAGAQVRQAITLSREAGIERVAGGDRPRPERGGSLGGSAGGAKVLGRLAAPPCDADRTERGRSPPATRS